ncbi:hypothetical protein [[Micrococcus luteus] ATCC 49442]|uniref:hypothetical protein n=1 Tax=[Micrococcus luteus] ATCC 49442 TaxID=2698727 RepID=UPI0013DCA43F|nr:hypothetical protein [[Micrococcus luteus] ATCC 49442]
MNLSPADLAFVLDVLERRGLFSAAKTAPDGRRRVVVEASLGHHNANRLAALLGATEPRKHGTRWRVRLKGENAEAVLRNLMPHFSEKSRGYAVAALDRTAKLRERREARHRDAA